VAFHPSHRRKHPPPHVDSGKLELIDVGEGGAPEAVAGPDLVELQSGVRLSFRIDEGRAAQ